MGYLFIFKSERQVMFVRMKVCVCVRARCGGRVPLKSAAAPELGFPMKSWTKPPVRRDPNSALWEDEPLRGVQSPAEDEEAEEEEETAEAGGAHRAERAPEWRREEEGGGGR